MKSVLLLIALFVAAAPAAVAQSKAIIEQVGTGNLLTLTQVTASQATILQGGVGRHVLLLEQTGTAYAEITQTGEGNRLFGINALGFGQEDLAARSVSSWLFLDQSGLNNTAFVSQVGGAYASITQSGQNNTVTVIQR